MEKLCTETCATVQILSSDKYVTRVAKWATNKKKGCINKGGFPSHYIGLKTNKTRKKTKVQG